jgi:hypothetical protein
MPCFCTERKEARNNMNWNYRCPLCSAWGIIDWADRAKSFTCHQCRGVHTPPTPADQHDAYVDTHEWPQEMEDEVVRTKGRHCTVPACTKRYETLDHRVAWSKGGPTSVDNLYPMCEAHNQSKGDQDYDDWLASETRFGNRRAW